MMRSSHNACSVPRKVPGEECPSGSAHSVFKNPVIAQLALSLALRVMVWADPPNLSANAPIVQMEPFFVLGSQVKWRYAQIPGCEILSSYPDPTTKDYLRDLG